MSLNISNTQKPNIKLAGKKVTMLMYYSISFPTKEKKFNGPSHEFGNY